MLLFLFLGLLACKGDDKPITTTNTTPATTKTTTSTIKAPLVCPFELTHSHGVTYSTRTSELKCTLSSGGSLVVKFGYYLDGFNHMYTESVGVKFFFYLYDSYTCSVISYDDLGLAYFLSNATVNSLGEVASVKLTFWDSTSFNFVCVTDYSPEPH